MPFNKKVTTKVTEDKYNIQIQEKDNFFVFKENYEK